MEIFSNTNIFFRTEIQTPQPVDINPFMNSFVSSTYTNIHILGYIVMVVIAIFAGVGVDYVLSFLYVGELEFLLVPASNLEDFSGI